MTGGATSPDLGERTLRPCRRRRHGAPVQVLLGEPEDRCCETVRDALEARGYETHVVASPVADPLRFAWSFDTEQSESTLAWDGERLRDDEIAGVLVRGAGWVDPSEWRPADLEYAQAETHAALLAWLWSLKCPVVNRYPPAVWYRPNAPLVAWHGLLRRSGLPTAETLVTNAEDEARAFGRQLALEGVEGAVYGPLTGGARYLVAGEEDWNSVAALQRVTPVCLAPPHGEVQRVCVVGHEVIWDGEPAAAIVSLERALRRFARASGLLHVEVALAPTVHDACVVAVDPQPRLENVGEGARAAVVDALVRLLTTDARRAGGTR